MRWKTFHKGILLAVCLGLIIPAPLVRAGTHSQAPTLGDVELGQGGLFWGQVVDSNGKPRQDIPVTLHFADRRLVTSTSESGHFAVKGFQGGICSIEAEGTWGVYRIWAANTAPPAAASGVLLVVGETPIRSQNGPIAYWLEKPWLVASIVAVAVAIPVVIHNRRMDRSASP